MDERDGRKMESKEKNREGKGGREGGQGTGERWEEGPRASICGVWGSGFNWYLYIINNRG